VALSLASLGITLTVGEWWIRLLSLAATVACMFALLSVLMHLTTTADLRRRRAYMWLRALESET